LILSEDEDEARKPAALNAAAEEATPSGLPTGEQLLEYHF
jgi:hypothetical protein